MFYFAQLFGCYFLEVREVETQRFRSDQRAFLLYMSTQYLTQCFIEQMRTRVVGCTSGTLVGIYTRHHRSIEMFGKLFGNVNRKVVFLFRINNVNGFEFADQYAGITYLTTAFCIERSLAQYDLIERLVLLLNLAVAQNAGFVFGIVITYEMRFAFFQHYPIACFYGCGIAGTLFLFLHFYVEFFFIDRHAVFAKNQFGQIERESESII